MKKLLNESDTKTYNLQLIFSQKNTTADTDVEISNLGEKTKKLLLLITFLMNTGKQFHKGHINFQDNIYKTNNPKKWHIST